jgi:hypothetical protein
MIDVSELTLDPDFASTFSVVARAYSVGTNGRTSLVESTATATGCVQAGAGDSLDRLPEAVRLRDVIRVWTKTPLKLESPGQYADLVVWQGRRYVAQLIDDHGHWGEGFVRAVCVSEAPNNG